MHVYNFFFLSIFYPHNFLFMETEVLKHENFQHLYFELKPHSGQHDDFFRQTNDTCIIS